MDQGMCKFTFSFNLDKFYEFFLADNALVYSIADHRQSEKDTDIQLTKWTPIEDNLGMFQREMKNVIKLSGVPFKDKSRMHKLFTYKKDPEKLIYTCTHTLDIHMVIVFKQKKSGKYHNQKKIMFIENIRFCFIYKIYNDERYYYEQNNIWIKRRF